MKNSFASKHSPYSLKRSKRNSANHLIFPLEVPIFSGHVGGKYPWPLLITWLPLHILYVLGLNGFD